MSVLRLDKYLSDCGVASRKEIREIIRSGRVTVDGVAETNFARKIDSGSAVALDGSALAYEKQKSDDSISTFYYQEIVFFTANERIYL